MITRDETIKMAREAGWKYAEEDSGGYDPLWKAMRLAYAAGAKAEREACAKVCDFEVARLHAIDEPRPALAAGICAAAIRARREK